MYVGPCAFKFRNWVMGHMFCDPGDVELLHAMARRIGLRRAWFQDKPNHPHYDIVESKRQAAIGLGAIPLDDFHEEACVHEWHALIRETMTEGTVFNLQGQILGKTENLSRAFLYDVQRRQKKGETFTVVHGPIRHKEVRELISDIRAMGVPVLAAPTPMVKSDVVLILEGSESEIAELLKETA